MAPVALQQIQLPILEFGMETLWDIWKLFYKFVDKMIFPGRYGHGDLIRLVIAAALM